MFKLRWPKSEPIHSQRELDKFYNLSVVSVIYYGDSKKEQSYGNFTAVIPHFSHTHQRFGHVVKWELKKRYAAKLPCIEVVSHVHELSNTTVLCRNLSKPSIKQLLERFTPPSHKLFHHGLSAKWFNGERRTAMAFFHLGVKTDQDRYSHRVFHQFFYKHNFQERIAEVDVNRVASVLLETRSAAGRDFPHRSKKGRPRHLHSREKDVRQVLEVPHA